MKEDYIPYRLSNILHGGKNEGETSWTNVPRLFPNSLGHRYTIKYSGKPISSSNQYWRSNINVINDIINDYKNEKNYIKYDRHEPTFHEVIVYMRMGDAIFDGKSKSDYFFEYKDIKIDVRKEHVHKIDYYEKLIPKIKEYNINKVVLMGNMFHKNIEHKTENNNIKYLDSMIDFFESNGLDVECLIERTYNPKSLHHENVDREFIYMTDSKYYIPSKTHIVSTSFSNLITNQVRKNGGIVL